MDCGTEPRPEPSCDEKACAYIAAITDKSMTMEEIMPHLGRYHSEYIHIGQAVETSCEVVTLKKVVPSSGTIIPCAQPHVLVSCTGKKNNRPKTLDPARIIREKSLVAAVPAQRCNYQRILNDVIVDSEDLETFYVAACGLSRVNGIVYCEKHKFLVKKAAPASSR